jgi:hypothetical protein
MLRTLRRLVTIAVLLGLGAALLSNSLDWARFGLSPLARSGLVVLVLALLVSFVLFRPRATSLAETALGKPVPMEPSRGAVAEAYMSATRSYDSATIRRLVEMLVDLPNYLVRINEDVTLDEAPRLCLEARHVYRVGSAQDAAGDQTSAGQTTTAPPSPSLLLVPLLTVQKGTLLDTFTVADSTGSKVPTIPQTCVRGLLIRTLEALFEMIPEAGGSSPDVEAERGEVLGGLAFAICHPGPLHRQKPEVQQRIEQALSKINELPTTDAWKDRLNRFCRFYVDYYVIVAEVPNPSANHLVLSYSHRMPCESPATEDRNRWRGRLGLIPAMIDIPLNLYALQAGSYHLQVAASTGQYVYDHHLERLNTTESITQEKLRSEGSESYVRLYHEEGRPNAHLYVRRQGRLPAEPARLKTVIRFREIPPGALGGATIISIASTALIVFFALTHLGLRIDTSAAAGSEDQVKAALNSDVPALLLALPAFIAALVGSWTDLTHIRRASLTTYFALGGTMLLSLVSALYFVYDANNPVPTEAKIELLVGRTITTDYVWLMLGLLSATLTLFLIKRWIGDSRYYFSVVRKRVDRLRHTNVT